MVSLYHETLSGREIGHWVQGHGLALLGLFYSPCIYCTPAINFCLRIRDLVSQLPSTISDLKIR